MDSKILNFLGCKILILYCVLPEKIKRMGHMGNKDSSVLTVFMGFDVLQEGKALGVLKCIKNVIMKILPWALC